MRERELRKKAERELKDTKTLEIELQKVKQEKNQEYDNLKQEVQQLREIMAGISNSGITVPLKANSGQVGVIAADNKDMDNWKIMYVKEKDGKLRLANSLPNNKNPNVSSQSRKSADLIN